MTDESRESNEEMLAEEERQANWRFQEALERLATAPHKPPREGAVKPGNEKP
jgi:hypothetical protein